MEKTNLFLAPFFKKSRVLRKFASLPLPPGQSFPSNMTEREFQPSMEVVEVNFSSSITNFWDSLRIYYNHPNCINKQIIFSEHVFGAKFKSSLNSNECFKLYNELSTYLMKGSDICDNFKNERIFEFIDVEHVNTTFMDTDEMYLLIRKLIPKMDCGGDFFYEFFFLDKQLTKAYIYTQHVREDTFNICSNSREVVVKDPLFILKFKQIEVMYSSNIIRLSYTRDLGEKGINWLKEIFINKIIKIMRNMTNEINRKNKNSDSLCFTSKIDLVQYYKYYEQMKLKYAKSLIENWSENTDPQKFVFEDIGIATYLMLLWNNGNIPEELSDEERIRFVDLGCGNGLLVHILNSEGHLGVGLDIRKRKIWDTYPPTTVLREETVNPTKDTIYPDADWLIGNHSDELTAWIPIMARRSNKCCQYFVLPCCPFQLNGEKFQRRNSGLSSYTDFINYVKDISQLCEFETYIDKLRIPSTKRVCLIGFTQSDMSEEKYNSTNMKIMNFIQEEFKHLNNNLKRKIGETEEEGAALDNSLNFKVRESKEKIRNCTKLQQELVNTILKAVTESLLKHKSPHVVAINDSTSVWNRGGKLSISELAKGIHGELLKQLKVQCKGLQTLLKNHHYVFEVSNGYAQFRSPNELLQISTKLLMNGDKLKWKKRSCWFYSNHPDKCPLSDSVCSYSHDRREELDEEVSKLVVKSNITWKMQEISQKVCVH